MGEMATIRVMRHLLKEWTLPDEMKVIWDANKSEETSYAKNIFQKYLDDGWMAFVEEPTGRKQIFEFNAKLKKIILIPPLGGG